MDWNPLTHYPNGKLAKTMQNRHLAQYSAQIYVYIRWCKICKKELINWDIAKHLPLEEIISKHLPPAHPFCSYTCKEISFQKNSKSHKRLF